MKTHGRKKFLAYNNTQTRALAWGLLEAIRTNKTVFIPYNYRNIFSVSKPLSYYYDHLEITPGGEALSCKFDVHSRKYDCENIPISKNTKDNVKSELAKLEEKDTLKTTRKEKKESERKIAEKQIALFGCPCRRR